MIKTMRDCTEWRKSLLVHVDLPETAKAVILRYIKIISEASNEVMTY